MQPHWAPDPTRRHALRWWDGQQWTDNVLDGQSQSTDPLVPPAGAAASVASFIGSVGRSSDAGTPVDSRRAAWAWFGGLTAGALVLGGVVAFGGNHSDDKVVTIAVTSSTSAPASTRPDAISTGPRPRSTRRSTGTVQAAATTASTRTRSTTTRSTTIRPTTGKPTTTPTAGPSTSTTVPSSSTTSPAAGTVVRSGAPCTQPGAAGVTAKGLAMTCAATLLDPNLKWRRAG